MVARKATKIIFLLFLILSAVLAVYYFTPKSITSCGSTLPAICHTCICKSGFPSARYIGSNKVDCFLGGEPQCSENKIISITSKECEAKGGQVKESPPLRFNNQTRKDCPDKEAYIGKVNDMMCDCNCCLK
jgi:hypothetical protein